MIVLGFVCVFLMVVAALAWSNQGFLGWIISGQIMGDAIKLLGKLLEALNSN